MQCHSTPPMPGWRQPGTPTLPLNEVPFWYEVDVPDPDPQMPEPPEHGPLPPVLH